MTLIIERTRECCMFAQSDIDVVLWDVSRLSKHERQPDNGPGGISLVSLPLDDLIALLAPISAEICSYRDA